MFELISKKISGMPPSGQLKNWLENKQSFMSNGHLRQIDTKQRNRNRTLNASLV